MATPKSYATVEVDYEETADAYIDFDAVYGDDPNGTYSEGSGLWRAHVYARHIPVYLNQPGKAIKVPLQIEKVQAGPYHPDKCKSTVELIEGVITVFGATFDDDGQISVRIDPRDAYMDSTYDCVDYPPGSAWSKYWTPDAFSSYWQAPDGYGPTPEGGYVMTGWTKLSPALYRWHDKKPPLLETEIDLHVPSQLINPT
jgi:hypothetical protein